MTKEEYGENLEENIEDLIARLKKFSYKHYPVRRAYIPKGNGKMRGLGIPSFEDKVVQGVFKGILEAVYAFWTVGLLKLPFFQKILFIFLLTFHQIAFLFLII